MSTYNFTQPILGLPHELMAYCPKLATGVCSFRGSFWPGRATIASHTQEYQLGPILRFWGHSRRSGGLLVPKAARPEKTGRKEGPKSFYQILTIDASSGTVVGRVISLEPGENRPLATRRLFFHGFWYGGGLLHLIHTCQYGIFG
jgi:hypothetical protein